MECHEQWTYLEDERPRVQRLDGLVSLCPACHESTHTGFARTRGRYAEAMRHLVAVNGWDLPRGEASFDACGRVWEERNRHDWTLDVSWLTRELGIAVEVKRPSAKA